MDFSTDVSAIVAGQSRFPRKEKRKKKLQPRCTGAKKQKEKEKEKKRKKRETNGGKESRTETGREESNGKETACIRSGRSGLGWNLGRPIIIKTKTSRHYRSARAVVVIHGEMRPVINLREI